MITFSVGLLEKQDITLQGTEKPELLELDDDLMFNAQDPIVYDLVAHKVSAGALITGKASTRLTGACGRCLAPAEITLATDDLQLFIDIGDEEIVDITEDIRTELLINLPANLLCSDDCRGLCPVCGCNLNTDDCDCVVDNNTDGADDDEPSPWDALDKLDLKK